MVEGREAVQKFQAHVGTSDLESELPTGPVSRTLGSNREILPTKLYETLGMCSKMY